ncbi:class II glutamine amidotransferase [Kineosporia sp. J2-2]|uniref:Class II glutamine amidotransferase n=1 Tax=Kineosporia corallincola TaxID=2835133 RepID=A0ABS5TMQ8_9ACTN|nr:class II glutamine amidotransferase [Kineosporia corallincola]MBT0772300.1 class II glutamine amidotransferase [Kineosporia corallincola]
MCRLLGVVSSQPAPIAELVAEDLEPFIQLACEHKDGWGVAFRDELGAVGVVKGIDRADDSDMLRGLLKSCVTDMAVLHLRMASPNLAVEMANTHPFGDARAAFAHNGEIRPVAFLESLISPELLATADGTTDSERFYLAVREQMDHGATPEEAIARTTTAIREGAEMIISLNSMMLTPTGLFTYSEHDPESEVIGRRGKGYFGLSYHRSETKTLVASEGWPQPQPQWQPLPEQRVAEFTTGSLAPQIH